MQEVLSEASDVGMRWRLPEKTPHVYETSKLFWKIFNFYQDLSPPS
jgi:hypothetical protein